MTTLDIIIMDILKRSKLLILALLLFSSCFESKREFECEQDGVMKFYYQRDSIYFLLVGNKSINITVKKLINTEPVKL